MDYKTKEGVKKLTEKYGAENIVVLIGEQWAWISRLSCKQLQLRPNFAGPLAGVPLGLKVYHPVEPEFKESVDPDVYDEQIGMMENGFRCRFNNQKRS